MLGEWCPDVDVGWLAYLSEDLPQEFEEKTKGNRLFWVKLMMFDDEMSKQVALSDVSTTNMHQSETSSRQEKRHTAFLI